MKSMRDKKYSILLLIFLLAFITRLLFIFLMLPTIETRMSLRFDGDTYGEIATRILDGNYTAVERGPCYPLFIAATYRLFGTELTPVRVLQALIDSATAVLLCAIALLMGYAPRTALLASLLYLLYPLALWRVCFVNKETVFTFLAILFMGGLLYSLRNERGRLFYCGAGILLGIANLCKPVLLLFPIVLFFYLVWKTGSWKRGIGQVTALLIGMVLAIVPWTLRNYSVTGRFLPVATERGGVTTYIGNYYPSRGAWEGDTRPLWEKAVRDIADENPDLSAIELDRLYYKKTAEYILHHPLGTVKMWVLKFWRFWFMPASNRLIWLTIPIQLFLLITAFLGRLAPGRPADNDILPLTFILYLTAVHVLSYSCIRFSLPVMPYVVLYSAYFLDSRMFSKIASSE